MNKLTDKSRYHIVSFDVVPLGAKKNDTDGTVADIWHVNVSVELVEHSDEGLYDDLWEVIATYKDDFASACNDCYFSHLQVGRSFECDSLDTFARKVAYFIRNLNSTDIACQIGLYAIGTELHSDDVSSRMLLNYMVDEY